MIRIMQIVHRALPVILIRVLPSGRSAITMGLFSFRALVLRSDQERCIVGKLEAWGSNVGHQWLSNRLSNESVLTPTIKLMFTVRVRNSGTSPNYIFVL